MHNICTYEYLTAVLVNLRVISTGLQKEQHGLHSIAPHPTALQLDVFIIIIECLLATDILPAS